MLNTYKGEYAIYLEYLVIHYLKGSEKSFLRIFLIFIETSCFKQHNYYGLLQICWFSLLEELQPQDGLVTDGVSFVLPNSSYVLFKVILKKNNHSPVFKVEEKVSKPIEKKDEFLKLPFVGTNTYLALDEETRVPKWQITLPILLNDKICEGQTVLVFVVFSNLERTENGYKEIALESMTNKPDFVLDSSNHNKLRYKLCIKFEKDILKVELQEFGQIVNEWTTSWYTLKTEKFGLNQLDARFFHLDFVKCFNGAVVTIKNLNEQKTDLRKSRTNDKPKTKRVLFILLGLIYLLFIFLFFLRKCYKRFRRNN